MPPSCGAELESSALPALPPPSLLLRALLPRIGGANPPGAFGSLGMGGAPEIEEPEGPSLTFPNIGADRSLTTVTFFSLVPLEISPNNAPL